MEIDVNVITKNNCDNMSREDNLVSKKKRRGKRELVISTSPVLRREVCRHKSNRRIGKFNCWWKFDERPLFCRNLYNNKSVQSFWYISAVGWDVTFCENVYLALYCNDHPTRVFREGMQGKEIKIRERTNESITRCFRNKVPVNTQNILYVYSEICAFIFSYKDLE